MINFSHPLSPAFDFNLSELNLKSNDKVVCESIIVFKYIIKDSKLIFNQYSNHAYFEINNKKKYAILSIGEIINLFPKLTKKLTPAFPKFLVEVRSKNTKTQSKS